MNFYVLKSTLTDKVYFDMADSAFEAQKACRLSECINLFSSPVKAEAIKVFNHYKAIEKQHEVMRQVSLFSNNSY